MPISIDTYRHEIVQEVLKMGIDIVNNIYVKKNKQEMFKIIQESNTPFVLMHMLGEPKTMQSNIKYKDFKGEIMNFFEQNITELNQIGFKKIILDPGFGFGKTLNQNYELINMIPDLKKLGYPVLIGVSRKSMITKALNNTTEKSLNGTTILNTICLMQGANIIRVHDVKEAKESLTIFNLVKKNKIN